MRLTDEQIIECWKDVALSSIDGSWGDSLVATVRKCLAIAALPDAPSDYADRERRGFSVSQPGELPR